MNEFNNFIIHLEETIFEETVSYVTAVTGEDVWDEKFHDLHDRIMRKAIETLAEKIR